MNASLPAFANAVRQSRQNEAFNDWFRKEAEKGLRDTPLARQQAPPDMSPTPKRRRSRRLGVTPAAGLPAPRSRLLVDLDLRFRHTVGIVRQAERPAGHRSSVYPVLSNTTVSATIKLSSPATHEFWEIPVLYEDEHLLALDKPERPADLARPHRAGPPEPDEAVARGHRARRALGRGRRTDLPDAGAPARCRDQRRAAAGQEQAGARHAGELVRRGEARQAGTWRSCRARPRRTGSQVEAKLAPHPTAASA